MRYFDLLADIKTEEDWIAKYKTKFEKKKKKLYWKEPGHIANKELLVFCMDNIDASLNICQNGISKHHFQWLWVRLIDTVQIQAVPVSIF